MEYIPSLESCVVMVPSLQWRAPEYRADPTEGESNGRGPEWTRRMQGWLVSPQGARKLEPGERTSQTERRRACRHEWEGMGECSLALRRSLSSRIKSKSQSSEEFDRGLASVTFGVSCQSRASLGRSSASSRQASRRCQLFRRFDHWDSSKRLCRGDTFHCRRAAGLCDSQPCAPLMPWSSISATRIPSES